MEPEAIYHAVKKYPMLCSWCQSRGIRTVVSQSTIMNSHGICRDCSADLIREQAPSTRKDR